MVELTEAERWLLINALTTAIQQYEIDAARYEEGLKRIERQFRDQANAARAMADRLEQAETIIIK